MVTDKLSATVDAVVAERVLARRYDHCRGCTQ